MSIKPHRLVFAPALAAALTAVLLFAGALPAFAQATASPPGTARPAQQPPAAPTVAPTAPSAIALADIPLEADRLTGVLRALEARSVAHPAVVAIEARLPEMAQRITDEKLETTARLGATSSITGLVNLADLWAGIRSELGGWAAQVRARATDLGAVLDELAALNDTWTRTRDDALRAKAPPAVLKRTNEALAAIAATRALASAGRAALLNLQVKIGEQVAAADEVVAQVAAMTAADLSTLLDRDQPPLWSAWRKAPPTTETWSRLRASAAPQLDVLARFLAGRSWAVMTHVVLLVLFVALTLSARRQTRARGAAGSADLTLSVFELPFSTALIVTFFVNGWVYERPPMIAINVAGLVLLVPLLRILRRLTVPAPTAALWFIAVLFLVNRFRDMALLNLPFLEQCVMVLLTGGAAAALVWLRGRQALVIGRYRVPEPVAWLGIGLLATSFVFGALGYMRMARYLGGGVLRSIYTAVGLYTVGVVALGFFAYLLRIWPLARLHMVEEHRLLFERRATVLLSWAVTVAWISTTLRSFSLLDAAESLGLSVLDYRLTRGFVSLSLGDVLAFVATVWLAFLLSRFVRFALQEDVYPRLSLGRGVPYALSNLLHYLILLLGFLAAIGAMGVDLNRVTLLTGAFGVGVGFGLQTIVNNFVSGIILLLERPIQVGDAIQMADLDGEVRRIGIRSTTVHTWRGAEVIVPNATLISGNVTNWTLSDRTRRFELPVGVAYGADPERVIELLRQAAASVPGVLAKPAPVVLFQGFGDSALNFEVRAWTARFEEWAAVHSQVAVAVNAALKAAGIEVPFPQRDVTVRFRSGEET